MSAIKTVVAQEITVSYRAPIKKVIAEILRASDPQASDEILNACKLEIIGGDIVISGFVREILSGQSCDESVAPPVGSAITVPASAGPDTADPAPVPLIHVPLDTAGSRLNLPPGAYSVSLSLPAAKFLTHVREFSLSVDEERDPKRQWLQILRVAWGADSPEFNATLPGSEEFWHKVIKRMSKVVNAKHKILLHQIGIGFVSNNATTWSPYSLALNRKAPGMPKSLTPREVGLMISAETLKRFANSSKYLIDANGRETYDC